MLTTFRLDDGILPAPSPPVPASNATWLHDWRCLYPLSPFPGRYSHATWQYESPRNYPSNFITKKAGYVGAWVGGPAGGGCMGGF